MPHSVPDGTAIARLGLCFLPTFRPCGTAIACIRVFGQTLNKNSTSKKDLAHKLATFLPQGAQGLRKERKAFAPFAVTFAPFAVKGCRLFCHETGTSYLFFILSLFFPASQKNFIKN
jgi:hypothetical protein